MPSKNIPVNGWPQIKELDTAAPILAELDKIETWQKSVKQETKSGAYVEFTNALALNASSVIAEITASQDLHGYDKPWVGGAGKNLLPMTVAGIKAKNTRGTWSDNVYTDTSGVVFTILTDNADNVIGIKANGTPTNLDSMFYLTDSFPAVSGTTYTINGSPSGVSGSTYRIFPTSSVAFAAGNRLSDDTSWDATRTAAGNESVTFYIQIVTGVAADNLIFYPMIRLASVTDATFAPYTNICPITGYSSVTITDVDAESHTATVTVSLGSTVYGGTLDLTSGELTITHAIVDLGDLSYNKDTTTRPADGATIHAFFATLSDCKKVGNDDIPDMKCSQYATDSWRSVDYGGYNSVKDGIIGGADNNSRIWIYDSQYNDVTVTAFKTAMSGVQLCYELATPTTTTLTAAQLKMVKGYNRISANSGNIEVTAYTGNTWN